MIGVIADWCIGLAILPHTQLVWVYHLQLIWEDLLLASLVADYLNPGQSLISLTTVQPNVLTSCIWKGDECRNYLAKESLELRLEFSFDLAKSPNVGNGLSTPAAPQPGHSTSDSRAHWNAFWSKVELFRGLKRLSALFQSLHPLGHGSLIPIMMLLPF